MGEVWRAEDLHLPRSVAIKLLPHHLGADREAAERLLREAQAAASVDHPGVVAVYEAGFVDGRPYLVMQRVEGETLEARLTRGPLGPLEALAITRQIADALAEVHALGIVHRDLKPANIVLSPRGPRILDFGLASLRDSPRLTSSLTILGTPRFLSPEQVKGAPCDNRADLWALGVMLYEMLTGAPPFGGDTLETLTYQVLNHAPDPPSRARPEVPPDADYLVLKLLRKDPGKRYTRAEDLIADLDSLLAPAPDRAPAVETEMKIPRLAVVPFEVMSAEADDSYLATGLAEDLIVDLTRLGGLRVASRAEVMPYRDRVVPPRTLARELSADFVLLGSVRRAGNRARISAQLVSAADGNTLWADRFDRTLEDLFDVQAEVSRAIVEALRVTLRPGEREMLGRAPTTNTEAYALYLQARDLIDLTREGNRRAEEMLKRAIQMDTRFSLALAALGETYAIRAMRWWETPEEAARLGELYARQALALEPDLVDAHLVMARVHRLRGDSEALLAGLERVFEMDPDHPEALLYAGWSYMAKGMPQRALTVLPRLVERHPSHYMGASFLSTCYEMLGHADGFQDAGRVAIERAIEFVRIHPGREGAHARSILATNLVQMGRSADDAIQQARMAVESEPDDGRLHYNLACIYARLGRADEAIAELRAGVATLKTFLGDWPQRDPDMANVRDHPEFVKLFGRAVAAAPGSANA
jgi:TolB-like protein/Flp pilus assembly protein TadD